MKQDVKNSMNGEVFSGESRAQRVVKGSTGGQGLNGWSIHFLEIRKVEMMGCEYSNMLLPCLDKLIPKCSENIAKV